MVTFYPVKFDTYESLYNHKDENGEVAKIQVEVLEEESDADPEGYEGYEGSTACVTLDEDRDKENTTHLQDPSHPSHPSPPRAQATCSKCGLTGDAFHMKIHIANCEGTD